MQQQQHTEYKAGRTYIHHQPNLGKILKDQEGTFEVVSNGQSFLVSCEPGHSIVDFVPNGTRNVWLVTKQESQLTEESEDNNKHSRAAGASG